MYFSMGCAFRSICVCHDTRTAVGVRKVTVMFSGVAGMVPIITIIACYYAIYPIIPGKRLYININVWVYSNPGSSQSSLCVWGLSWKMWFEPCRKDISRLSWGHKISSFSALLQVLFGQKRTDKMWQSALIQLSISYQLTKSGESLALHQINLIEYDLMGCSLTSSFD